MTAIEHSAPHDDIGPETYALGPVTVTVDGIDLRDIRWTGVEAYRRIYPVFQDVNWTNRPFAVLDRRIEVSDGRLTMTASGTGSFDASPLTWEVTAVVTSRSVDYRFVARTDEVFERNRLGLCLLHPMSSSGGACRVSHVDGTTTSARFPVQISPHQPFVDITAISHEVVEDAWATVTFTGEVFEMEDHRNWSDASFKTYCTPITLPFPVTVAPGDVIDHSLSITFSGTAPHEPAGDQSAPEIHVTEERSALPLIGIGLNPDDLSWTAGTLERVRSFGLDHGRVPVRADDPAAARTIRDAASLCASLGVRLHVAVICDDPSDLRALQDLPDATVAMISRWTVVSRHHKVTPPSWAPTAREALGDAMGTAELGGGTDLYFTELNREPPGPSDFDVTNFSLTPQVHAFDDRTLVQNAIAQSVIAQDAPRVSDGTRISVAPISLRPRFNPNATDPSRDVSNTSLPSDVDARQRTWFAACWTASSIKHLSEPNTLASLTYFETPGWKGIVAGDLSSSSPADFPMAAGEALPVAHVFAALSGATSVRRCEATQPEVIDALIVQSPSWTRILTINWTSEPRQVSITGSLSITVDAAPETVTVTELLPTERTS